jgi:hypothetical protein
LFYESIGLMRGAGQEPITYYVRCATILGLSGGPFGLFATYSLVFAICFLVGHWLLAWRDGVLPPPAAPQTAAVEAEVAADHAGADGPASAEVSE